MPIETDLQSDPVTRPTPEGRWAIAEAEQLERALLAARAVITG